jgi:mannose-6-phosphate isomerase-like protein (cupin superfamily)
MKLVKILALLTLLAATFASFSDHWSPRIIGKVNDQYVKVAKLKGQLAWHKHDHEDEMFIVVYGRLVIQLEGKEAILNPGDFYVVPKNTMHNPMAEEECGIVLIETMTTLHTGSVQTSLTKSIQEQLIG